MEKLELDAQRKAAKEAKKRAKEEKAKQKAEKAKQDAKGVTKLGLHAKKNEDFGEWYSQLVVEAEMISYYEVSGCYILRPWSFAIWDEIQRWFDNEIRNMGVQNAYFPLFVTEDALMKEKDHVEGFAPEVAWVTKSGSSDMERPVAIRPTSETVMYPQFAQWIRSHRDLPLRLNQWTNVVRWEFKHPTPFIRSREFLWQEGHTAFASKEEADDEVLSILELYKRVYEELLAVPVCKGRKSSKEKFAGADYTTSVEAFVPATGRGVQGATSHHLGQNFSKMFDIEYETEAGGEKARPWQNSWGMSTRVIGVMVMVHGDDTGLVLPPRVAHIQAVIIPIQNKKMTDEAVQLMTDKVHALCAELQAAGVRATTDCRENYTPGWKYNHWELKGVPLRIELGPRDMENSTVMFARRDTKEKSSVAWADVATAAPAMLDRIQKEMLERARNQFDECTEMATNWDDFMAALDRKHMCLAPWADEESIEEGVRKKSATDDMMGAKTLNIPFDQPDLPEGTPCFFSGKPAKNWALWGRSY
ncbi:hypothetical protein M9434_005284 [Picochlorum sp. BPE23]|nr:hypothetical protein M9434_005284 [Picochlorum sp. BPE23]